MNSIEALVGTTHAVTVTVTETDLAAHVGSGDLPVLATPRMAALMEQAAAELIFEALGDGITSVGTQLSISHTAPTLTGATVTAEATLTATDGRTFSYTVRAFDGVGTVGEGTHTRVSVKADRFLEKAAQRAQ